MIKDNNELKLSKNEVYQIELELNKTTQVVEGLAELIIRQSIDDKVTLDKNQVKRPLWTKRQDHGTRGNKMFNTPKGWNKTRIDKLEEIIDSEIDGQSVDFEQLEDELNTDDESKETREDIIEYSTTSSYKTSKYDYLLGDLEIVGQTPEKIANMSFDELEAFYKWLQKRTK